MSIFEQIKQDRDAARKARDQFTLTTLSTLIGEIETKHRSGDKDYADLNVAAQKIIKKTIESCNEMYKIKKNDNSLLEIEILEKYLPANLTPAEINGIFDNNDFKEVKDVMQFFKALGKPVDMKQVRDLFMARM